MVVYLGQGMSSLESSRNLVNNIEWFLEKLHGHKEKKYLILILFKQVEPKINAG